MSILPSGEKYVHRGVKKGSSGSPGETRRVGGAGCLHRAARLGQGRGLVWPCVRSLCDHGCPEVTRRRHAHAEHSNGRGQHRTRAGDATNHPRAWQSRARVESLGLGLGLGGWPTQARHRNGVERFLKILKTREVYVTAVCLSGKSIAVYHTCETDLDQESQRFL